MGLDPERIGHSDVEAFLRAVNAAFGKVPDDEDIARHTGLFDPEFAIGVRDRGRIVATASATPFQMTLPAGPGQPYPTVAVPGVTAVGVVATHRRQGLLTRMMHHQLSDFRDRGYPLAILLASEGSIYGRFGYGLAEFAQSIAVDSRRAAFRAAGGPGRMSLVDADGAAKLLPDIHDRARRARPGELNRSALYWEHYFMDVDRARPGEGGRFYAVHESAAGAADGWVSYWYHRDWKDGLPEHRVEVYDLVGIEPAVVAALWRFVLNLDLVGEVTLPHSPMDETLRWLLTDPRQVRTTSVSDHVWACLIDIPAALAARGYGAEHTLVIEVDGEGRFVLETGLGAGSCRKAKKGEKADLALDRADLGAIYLGGVRPSELAAASRVIELRPGALVRADQAFVGHVLPFTSIGF